MRKQLADMIGGSFGETVGDRTLKTMKKQHEIVGIKKLQAKTMLLLMLLGLFQQFW